VWFSAGPKHSQGDLGVGLDRRVVEGARHRDQRGAEARGLDDLLALGRPQHASRLGQLLVGEEAGLTAAHREAELLVHRAVVVEEEEADRALVGVAVDLDLVLQRLAYGRQIAVIGQLAAEQAVDPFAAVERVDAEIGDEQQVGLARLDQDPGGHAALVEVPAVLLHVGRCADRAGAHGSWDRVDGEHAIGEEERGLRHPDLARPLILFFEQGAKDLRDLPAGVDQELLAAEAQAWALRSLGAYRGQGGLRRRARADHGR
jgi:hypothetical protein